MIAPRIPAAAKAAFRSPIWTPLRPHSQWQRTSQLRNPHPSLLTRLPKLLRPLTQQAKSIAHGDKDYEIPERLLIYHAGTGRITFLAMLKLTALLMGAFFTLLVVPSYVRAEKPLQDTAAAAACGVVPMLFVAYSTAPFVTHMHVHLPAAARASPAVLKRFVAAMPPGTRLTLTTMSSFTAKPRCSAVRVGELRAAVPGTRFGLVNYVRDVEAEDARRKWYMYRAVRSFYVQDARARHQAKKQKQQQRQQQLGEKGKATATVVHTWIWDAARDKIAKRERAAAGSV
ncbi:uncharacterized protein MAM_07568 [Metarhizium album ARSEF 1941]|uniref:Uncharacterized protein n=1 Tax=Metarhizium album (strain ARSEF 1941) TaxID=1081103 RepID=A0A0B2WKP6_METAS|nr:uncharacterized protein MAM_07568 [Metarhizium album ARSEF 1941]KHN94513.1 hypothetical protein MAM_07568 [Metarhizium album ARSEF 1941]